MAELANKFRWIACAVIALLPLQSFAASFCVCSCNAVDVADACGHEDHEHDHCHQHSQESNDSELSQPGCFGLAPCNCPPSCPCQLSHTPETLSSPKSTTHLENSSEVVSDTIAAELTFVRAPQRDDVALRPVTRCKSSLTRCAALCRFVI